MNETWFRFPSSGFRVPGWLVGRASSRAVNLEFGRAGSSAASPHPNNSEPGTRNSELQFP